MTPDSNLTTSENKLLENINLVSKKEVEVTVLELVHCYFYFFHAWVPTNKYQKNLLKVTFVMQWITLLSMIIHFIGKAIALHLNLGELIFFDFLQFFFLASLILQLILLLLSFIFLSPHTTQAVIDRLNSKLFLTLTQSDLKQNNKYLQRYELEEIWINYYLHGIDLRDAINKIEKNMANRKPNSRNISVIFKNSISNPYIINTMAIMFTVILTITLTPLSQSITDENFSNILSGSLMAGLLIWFFAFLFMLVGKLVLVMMDASFEYIHDKRILVLWRYEILIDMLGCVDI